MKKEAYPKIDFGKLDWLHLLPQLGIDANLIANPKKRGPCPIEQEGHSRFRFDNKKGRGDWVCNCGAGDGVKLLALVHGISEADAVRMIRDHLYGAPANSYTRKTPIITETEKTPAEIEKARNSLISVSRGSKNLQGSLAQTYLQARIPGLKLEWISRFLRFHPSLFHKDDDTGAISRFPAMLGYVVNWGNPGKAVSIHRTYLSSKAIGKKAPVSPKQTKKMMTATVNKIAGEALKVNRCKSSTVVVAEGIENAFAWVAATENQYPAFAALNCYNLGQFIWPKDTKHLVIAADNDHPNPKSGLRPGLHYALMLKERAEKAGLTVDLLMPPVEGVDFDDLWVEGRREFFVILERQSQPAVAMA
ncbi:MAG: toprim domain-containing protein [Giesbergeria sp.]|uniref:DUF7146 domain-containing protein n=1 Tax=Giesbergeria sp. TaxID=2818473 RepID=UPI002621C478|nr:toprim domain-containing protein [Giesbergeria sp.]MDD2609420.1 toprim domain-containing protein [Giesbergeria sp.]